MVDALSRDAGEYPERMRAFQERIGCLMYAATSTRPDIAFAVHQLCKCLQKPTPALIHLFSYLARHADVGLTYTKAGATLAGYMLMLPGRLRIPPTFHLRLGCALAICRVVVGLAQAEEHRAVFLQSRSHSALRGRQRRGLPSQTRPRLGRSRARPHAAIYRQPERARRFLQP